VQQKCRLCDFCLDLPVKCRISTVRMGDGQCSKQDNRRVISYLFYVIQNRSWPAVTLIKSNIYMYITSVIIVTRIQAGWSGFNTWQQQEIVVLSRSSNHRWGPPSLLFKMYHGVQWPGLEGDFRLHVTPQLRISSTAHMYCHSYPPCLMLNSAADCHKHRSYAVRL
jgi:hypothetical protein